MANDLRSLRKLRAERLASAGNRAGRAIDDFARSNVLLLAIALRWLSDFLVSVERHWRDEDTSAAQQQLALDRKEGVADASRS
jgi:hypothetical protein